MDDELAEEEPLVPMFGQLCVVMPDNVVKPPVELPELLVEGVCACANESEVIPTIAATSAIAMKE